MGQFGNDGVILDSRQKVMLRELNAGFRTAEFGENAAEQLFRTAAMERNCSPIILPWGRRPRALDVTFQEVVTAFDSASAARRTLRNTRSVMTFL